VNKDNINKNNISDPYFAYRQPVPVGWKKLSIGEVTKIIRGISFPKDSKRTEPQSGYVACLRTANVQTIVEWDDLWFVPEEMVKRKEQIVEVGDILISTANSNYLVGKVSPVISIPQKSTLGAFISLLRPNKEVDHKFIYHQLAWSDTQSRIRSTASTTTNISNVSTKKLSNIELVIPPLEQQKRIVAEIEKQFSRLDEAVANLKRVKANLKRYKAAVLKAAVEGKLTEKWRHEQEAKLEALKSANAAEDRKSKAATEYEPASKLLERILTERRQKWEEAELAKMKAKGKAPKNDKWKKRYKEAENSKQEDTYEIPKTWEWTNLGQLSWSVKDGPHYSPKYSETGIPFISGGNIRPEGIDFSSTKYISPELHAELSERCKPEFEDLLYTKGGTTGIARINTETRDFNVWVHVAVLKLVDSIERFYIQHALNSNHCYRQSQRYTHGVGNQDLGLTRMIWITVPLPPLEEQIVIIREIEQRTTVVTSIEKQVDADLKRAECLRQSILSRAFQGGLVCS
jgi:type I restriction enzyme S subunit